MVAQTSFDVIAEPTRRRILDLLLAGELPVGELVSRLQLSQPAVSRHLRVLREAGLVRSRTDAQRRLYSIDARPLADLDAWLGPYRQLWAGRLGELAAHLDTMDDQAPAPAGAREDS